MDVSGIVVLPLDPPLFLDLEVVWRRPARPAVRRVVDFLVEAVDDPEVLVSTSRRRPGGGGGQGFRTTFSHPSALFLKMS
jgi:LysR family transcriptional regulator, benzoate and cis,cis-muconate-responsive activator of ben and cat genes